MNKRALRRSFCWFVVLVLPLVLILGVLPCAAEQSYSLQALIDKTVNDGVITIDNLTFSAFQIDPQYTFAFSPEGDLITPEASFFTVEPVGRGTSSPGLKFTPDSNFSVEGQSTCTSCLPLPFVQTITFSYQVHAAEGSGLIEGNVLILKPGTVEAAGDLAGAKVEDRGDPLDSTHYLAVMRETQESDSPGIYINTDTLRAETEFPPQATVSPRITVALSVSLPGGKASIQSFEHKVSLAPVEGSPIANAGPDQAVFDQVSLDGSKSSPTDAEYQWDLYKQVEGGLELFASAPSGVQATFTDLVNGFYEARLTVTNSGVSAVDTAIIAAAGPSGGGTEPEIQKNGELNLWDFTLKKYKYCKWSTARMVGTFDLPDDFEFYRGDDLVGKVTIQLNRGEEPLVVMSDDIKLKVRNWKYKMEISRH